MWEALIWKRVAVDKKTIISLRACFPTYGCGLHTIVRVYLLCCHAGYAYKAV